MHSLLGESYRMSGIRDPSHDPVNSTLPVTLPLSVSQYRLLVERGDFDQLPGQVELINGRIVQMNPQGPAHADPLDYLAEWSFKQAGERFTIRIEKPIEIADFDSSPEPDIAWVDRRRYAERHPQPPQVHLLIEASSSSIQFDSTEKLELYAKARIPEFWLIDINARRVIVFREPESGSYATREVFGVGQEIAPACLPTASLPIGELFL